MYNYYRWFPQSKIIFMAPTKPLVDQQMEASFQICGLSLDDTANRSSTVAPAQRRELWMRERVFFATPQTVQNDLSAERCPAEKVVCLAVDEDHRATGNYAFVDVINFVADSYQEFLVLGLTATPGSSVQHARIAVKNLRINNIQIRTEKSMDVREYSHGKVIKKVMIPLDQKHESAYTLSRLAHEYKAHAFQPFLTQLSKFPSGLGESDDDKGHHLWTNSKTKLLHHYSNQHEQ